MDHDEKFFYLNAGFSYDPKRETEEQGRRRTARELADAEAYAEREGWEMSWEPDYAEPGTLVIYLSDENGDVLAAVGGVEPTEGDDDLTNTDRRLYYAELALEATEGGYEENPYTGPGVGPEGREHVHHYECNPADDWKKYHGGRYADPPTWYTGHVDSPKWAIEDPSGVKRTMRPPLRPV